MPDVESADHAPPTPGRSWSKRAAPYLIASFMLISLGSLQTLSATREMTYQSVRIYGSLMGQSAWWIAPAALLLLICVVRLDNRLRRFDRRWLEWSPSKFKMNITVMPLTLKYFGLFYLGLLLYSLPFMAWIEEMLFRYAIDNWLVPGNVGGDWRWLAIGFVGVLWSGLLFGLAHLLLSLVSIRMTICLSFGGLVMLVVYLASGSVWVATAFHATYNVIAISWIVFDTRLKQPLQLLLEDESKRAHLDRYLPTIAGWTHSLVNPEPKGAAN